MDWINANTWALAVIVGSAIASTAAFIVSLYRIRLMRRQAKELELKVADLEREKEERDKLVKVATDEQTERFGEGRIQASRLRASLATRKLTSLLPPVDVEQLRELQQAAADAGIALEDTDTPPNHTRENINERDQRSPDTTQSEPE